MLTELKGSANHRNLQVSDDALFMFDCPKYNSMRAKKNKIDKTLYIEQADSFRLKEVEWLAESRTEKT